MLTQAVLFKPWAVLYPGWLPLNQWEGGKLVLLQKIEHSLVLVAICAQTQGMLGKHIYSSFMLYQMCGVERWGPAMLFILKVYCFVSVEAY